MAICARNSPVRVNSPHKGQWRTALMFSLICVRINGWVNNREAGDLKRRCAHYDVIGMIGPDYHGRSAMNTTIPTKAFVYVIANEGSMLETRLFFKCFKLLLNLAGFIATESSFDFDHLKSYDVMFWKINEKTKQRINPTIAFLCVFVKFTND